MHVVAFELARPHDRVNVNPAAGKRLTSVAMPSIARDEYTSSHECNSAIVTFSPIVASSVRLFALGGLSLIVQ
jgi:hypothetical protein